MIYTIFTINQDKYGESPAKSHIIGGYLIKMLNRHGVDHVFGISGNYILNPIMLVLNNHGYSTERPMLDGPFNDVQPWSYIQPAVLAFRSRQGGSEN